MLRFEVNTLAYNRLASLILCREDRRQHLCRRFSALWPLAFHNVGYRLLDDSFSEKGFPHWIWVMYILVLLDRLKILGCHWGLHCISQRRSVTRAFACATELSVSCYPDRILQGQIRSNLYVTLFIATIFCTLASATLDRDTIFAHILGRMGCVDPEPIPRAFIVCTSRFQRDLSRG